MRLKPCLTDREQQRKQLGGSLPVNAKESGARGKSTELKCSSRLHLRKAETSSSSSASAALSAPCLSTRRAAVSCREECLTWTERVLIRGGTRTSIYGFAQLPTAFGQVLVGRRASPKAIWCEEKTRGSRARVAPIIFSEETSSLQSIHVTT